MAMNREQEIQLQFLDEAQEYVKTLETVLVELVHGIDINDVNAALRAAHSIKGGASMMGFSTLSGLAHRLEDSLKVLKVQKNSIVIDPELEHLLLAATDRIRQVVEFNQRGTPIEPDWLETHATAIFQQLHDRLGDPKEEDAYSILSPEEGQDVIPLLFQTEIPESLDQLERAIMEADPELTALVTRLADELEGIGEMLQLKSFVRLCASVTQHLITAPHRVTDIAQTALQTWRRAQALVLTNHLSELPNSITVDGITVSALAEEMYAHVDISSMPESLEAIEPTVVTADITDEAPASEPRILQPILNQPARTLEPAPESSFADAKANTSPSDPAENTVRVPVKQLDRLNDLFGELTVERNGLDMTLKRLRGLVRTLTERIQVLERSNTELRDVHDKAAIQKSNDSLALLTNSLANLALIENQLATESSQDGQPTNEPDGSTGLDIRFDALELDRYNEAHPLSQEVMETIVQIQEVASDLELGLDEAEQNARGLNKTARQLQTRLTQIRMRPLSDVTDRFPRALRELSLQYGKPIQLQIEGADTLIDRNILEALSEPLMHLVRNAFDHGIEPPDIRQAWDKPEQGTITIRACHQNNRTLITISDDGGGIPLAKIRMRARQMGLDEMLLAAASDEELLSLIFEPGFSTSEQVTSLSGRGVGMDVVRNRLKQVEGEIKVDTQAGVGTTFTLSVPFTLSVMRVLVAESNGLLMAFPANMIQEMIMLSPERIITTAGSKAFSWNGMMVQLIRLSQWLNFNCPRPMENPEGAAAVGMPTVLLLPQGDHSVGMEVDRCWGEQEVAIRQVQGGPALPPGFSNCTILGDGRVVPLVSVPELLRWLATCQRSYTNSPPSQSIAPIPLSQAEFTSTLKPLHTVLIVDDSINVRRFLALTLEKAGYRVIQAKDGQEALEKLAADLTVQAVICDIEMPRLDGYGFLARLKSNPVYEQLPVAMLTTRSSDKHRQLALNLGATAYFSKPFNEQVLLQALKKMVSAA